MTGTVAGAAEPIDPTGIGTATRPAHASLLAALLLASTLTVMAGAVLVPVLELVRRDLGLGATQTGLVLTAHGLSVAAVSPLAGRIIDVWGLRLPLVGGLMLYAAAGGAGLVVGSYPALIAARLAFGVGAAAVFVGTTTALVGLYSGRLRDRVMGWRSSAISLGGLTWPLLGGALGSSSWQAPFALYLLGAPLAIAVLLTLPASMSSPGAAGNRGSTWALLRSSRRLASLLGVQTIAAALLYVVLGFVPLRLAELGVHGPLTVALCPAALSVAMTLAGLTFATARTRFGVSELLLLALLAWSVSLASIALASEPALIAAGAALFGLGMGLAVPALTVAVGEATPVRLRGRAISLLAVATFAGQFAAPLLAGPVVEATSAAGGFLVFAATAGVAFGSGLLARLPRVARG